MRTLNLLPHQRFGPPQRIFAETRASGVMLVSFQYDVCPAVEAELIDREAAIPYEWLSEDGSRVVARGRGSVIIRDDQVTIIRADPLSHPVSST